MSRKKPRVEVRKLTSVEKREVERRERKHRNKLAKQGYQTQALVDESGCFGVVLVSDPNSGKNGFLLPDGSVKWMDQTMGLGALADAAVSGVRVEGLPE